MLNSTEIKTKLCVKLITIIKKDKKFTFTKNVKTTICTCNFAQVTYMTKTNKNSLLYVCLDIYLYIIKIFWLKKYTLNEMLASQDIIEAYNIKQYIFNTTY